MSIGFRRIGKRWKVAVGTLAIVICMVGIALVWADEENVLPSKFESLGNTRVVDILLRTDVANLIQNKSNEDEQKAQLGYKDPSGSYVMEKMEVAARGNSRKDLCSIPPMRLEFKKKKLKKQGLAPYRNLKMVLPCQDDRSHRDFVLREALCYHLYGLITENSFKTQLARLELEDVSRSYSMKSYAFLIESVAELERRLGGAHIDLGDNELLSIDEETYNLLVLFQFMIGNTDWNMARGHNMKLIRLDGDRSPIPVPYDFDQSGLVNAIYSAPHPSMPISTTRERLFQWRGNDHKGLYNSIQTYLERKSAILAAISDFPGLSDHSRMDITEFVSDFFEVIEQEDAVHHLVAIERGSTAEKI